MILFKKKIFFIYLFIFFFIFVKKIFALNIKSSENKKLLDNILLNIEKQYQDKNFSADFIQESTIDAIDISDKASGKVFFKHPNMMRWEYEKPEKQIIIFNNLKLWVIKPEDNQVISGQSPSLFSEGKGASFLSNISVLREEFDIFLKKKISNFIN